MIRMLIVVVAFAAAAFAQSGYRYFQPKPDAEWVNPEINLAFRASAPIVEESIYPGVITLTGEIGGAYSGEARLAADGATLVFLPNRPFAFGERVTVALAEGVRATDGETLPALEYSFTTRPRSNRAELAKPSAAPAPEEPTARPSRPARTFDNGVVAPPDFPAVEVSTHLVGQTAEGYIFLSNMWGGQPYIQIVNNDGDPIYYRRMPVNIFDFKTQPTGVLSCFVSDHIWKYIRIDSGYNVLDTIVAPGGYGTNEHELQLTENGEIWQIGNYEVTHDMSLVGGQSDATVLGNAVLAQDSTGAIIFEWRGLDYFAPEDAIGPSLTGGHIDAIHMNSIDFDADGSVLISCRNQSQCLKIDRATGDVIWRLGRDSSAVDSFYAGQFTFLNEAHPFSWQHDIRPVGPNRYTIFDNGEKRGATYSRGVEYELDTALMTATNVWEYPSDQSYTSFIMGNTQRLPNGNTLMNFVEAGDPKALEVTSFGLKVFEADYEISAWNYRAFRLPWNGVADVPYLIADDYSDHTLLVFNKFGDETVDYYRLYRGTEAGADSLWIDSIPAPTIRLTEFPEERDYYLRVTAVDTAGVESDYSNEEKVFGRIVAPGFNKLLNGDFADSLAYWEPKFESGASAEFIKQDTAMRVAITNPGSWASHVRLTQHNVSLTEGKEYIIEFDAYATGDRSVRCFGELGFYPFSNLTPTFYSDVTTTPQHFEHVFTMTSSSSPQVDFHLEFGGDTTDVTIANVVLRENVDPVNAPEGVAPVEYRLEQNYPNPFNPTTTIRYDVRDYTDVRLTVHNALGEKVATLVNERQGPGSHEVAFDGANLASGVYFYRISAGSFVETKKMALIK